MANQIVLDSGIIETVDNGYRVFVNSKGDYLSKTYDNLNKAKSALRGAANPPKRKVAVAAPQSAPEEVSEAAPVPVVTTVPTAPDWKSGDSIVKLAQRVARESRVCEGTKLFCGSLWTLGGFLRSTKVTGLNAEAVNGFEELYKVARSHAEHKVDALTAERKAIELAKKIASVL